MVEINDWWLRMTIAMVQNTIDDWKNRLGIESTDRYGPECGDRDYRPLGLRISIGPIGEG